MPHPSSSSTKVDVFIPQIGGIVFKKERRIRRFFIKINAIGNVEVGLPSWMSIDQGKKLVIKSQRWIASKVTIAKRKAIVARQLNSKLKEVSYEEARSAIVNRLSELSRKHGISYNKVTIRNQKTRWGSCSQKNNISLNIKLARLRKPLMDYVILHELMHVKIKNHSQTFWDGLSQLMNNAPALRRELSMYTLCD